MPQAGEPLTPARARTIRRAYVKPGHPVAFSAPERVAKHFGVSKAAVKQVLEGVEGYTLHREYKQPRRYNPYYVHNRRDQVQADLIDISKIQAQNDRTRFLLVLIDIFTKKIWVYPLKNKSGAVLKRTLARWLTALRPTLPKVLMTDRGLEFTNAAVQQLLRSRGVEWRAAFGTLKACIAERVNKSLQLLIYKYLSENETLRYYDVLARLVKTYNTRGHRTLKGMTPNEADLPANEARVQAIFHQRYEQIGRGRRQSLPFQVGNLVRLKTEPKKLSSSSRAYAEQFQGEYFRIVRINRTLPIALYYLRSLDTDEMIEGGLYANELQRVTGETFKIESVLRRRVRRGREQLYVKWKYFGPRWNEWVWADDVTRVYN